MFEAPRLKIKWAKKHIADLDAALWQFIHADFCGLSIDKDPKTGNNVLKYAIHTPIPDEVPLMIGDAIHNLRAALDLMACEIISRAGKSPSQYARFPFGKNRDDLKNFLNGAEIKFAGPDIVSLILDVIKAYRDGGNEPLYALHALDITDKHKLLIPVITVARLDNVNATVTRKDGSVATTLKNMTFSVTDGRVIEFVHYLGSAG